MECVRSRWRVGTPSRAPPLCAHASPPPRDLHARRTHNTAADAVARKVEVGYDAFGDQPFSQQLETLVPEVVVGQRQVFQARATERGSRRSMPLERKGGRNGTRQHVGAARESAHRSRTCVAVPRQDGARRARRPGTKSSRSSWRVVLPARPWHSRCMPEAPSVLPERSVARDRGNCRE